MLFWNDLHQVCSKSKSWKTKSFLTFGSNLAKGAKQDSQNRLGSPMLERGKP